MVNNFIKPGLEDLCVSRTSVKWGIPVEFDKKHTIYVWIDALSNYLTGLGYLSENDENFKKYWPADLHMVGKDIVRFHAIIWPAILMALDLPLPKQIFGHGWLLLGGDKLSKSKKTETIECTDPRILVPRYSADAVRYYLLREIPFGSDGNYSTEALLNRFNSDLCNNFGNLVSRTFSMLKKYFNLEIPAVSAYDENEKQLQSKVMSERENVQRYMDEYDVSKAIASVFDIFSEANTYIQLAQPWAVAKEENGKEKLKAIMRSLLETIRIGCELLAPFMPNSAKKVLDALGVEGKEFSDFDKFEGLQEGQKIAELSILFPRLDIAKELEELSKLV